jgi:zinc transport system substrate-binding protein
MRSTPRTVAALAVALAVTGSILGACGGGQGEPAASSTEGRRLQVVTSFYPLQFALERVGGNRIDVANLVPAGTEPHDLELTPRDLAELDGADLVVYLAGFAPAVDDAAGQLGSAQVFDVTPVAELDLTLDDAEDGAADVDPHFWLDPLRLAAVGDEVARRLADLEPDGATTFAANAGALRAELEALDAEFEAGLAGCERRDLVTSHRAFGYLARRYGLRQVGVVGVAAEEEPTPADLAGIVDFVERNDVQTIYSEPLASAAVAETVAAETGARTAVLDPLEGLSDTSRGADYPAIMRANLVTLREGQACP